MSLNHTIILFFIESLFFVGTLTTCLVFAAKKHRNNLKEVVEQVNKSKLFRSETLGNTDNSKELLEKLKGKINKLQNQVSLLEKIEQKYYALKEKYNTDIKALKQQLSQSKIADPGAPKKNIIEVGTTLNTEYGVDQNYLNFLSKKKNISDASQSTIRASHESKVLNKKLEEQRKIITDLENNLKSAEMSSAIESIKNGQKDAALRSLKILEKSLKDSQTNGQELEADLVKVRKALDTANNKVSLMEMKDRQPAIKQGGQNTETDGEEYHLVSRFNTDESNIGNENEAMNMALRDHEKIKQEVETLRKNTTQQRQLIFTLESEILALRKDLKISDLTGEEKAEQEKRIEKLEGLLQETETCVEVLESEVSYLHDKLTDYDSDSTKSLQEMHEDCIDELGRTQAMLERATDVRSHLSNIIRLSNLADPKEALEISSKRIIETFSPLDISVYLKIVSQFGEIDISNAKSFDADKIEFLTMAIHENMDTTIETEEGFLVVHKRIGAFVKAPLAQKSSLGKLRDTVNFILLVSNAVIGNIDERQSTQVRQTALKNLVDGVKSKISQLSVQSKYQSDEAKNIFDGLVNELNNCLNTMNITENQSQFFNQMIEEAKDRMSILLASEMIVDKSFIDLLDRIKRGTVYLQNK